MTPQEIRSHLIKNGVKNLREFGYPNPNAENILTDEVYSVFFVAMLKENISGRKDVDAVINELLQELKK